MTSADELHALEAALEAMRRGEPVEAEAPLALVAAARAAASLRQESVPAPAQQRSRRRFLIRAESLQRPAPWLRRLAFALPRHAATALIVLAVAAAGFGGLSGAAAQSLPGDPLYSFKLATEDLTLLLSADQQRRSDLETLYTERRTEEVLRLLALGRVVPLTFHGTVIETGPVVWNVAAVPVRLTPETEVLGEILPGMVIEVDGLTQSDGFFLAHRLHLRQYDLLDRLDSVDDRFLVVAGTAYRITTASRIDAGLTPGELVLARISIDDTGERRVISAQPFAGPTPTPIATARPSATPLPPSTVPAASSTPDADEDGDKPDDDDDGDDDDGEQAEPQQVDFEGTVTSISASRWTISGRTVVITAGTEIRDNPQIGDEVKVRALVYPDGTWVAERIELED